jgi:hypothetical protein
LLKVIALLTRKPGMSRNAFIVYCESMHVPLVSRLFPQIFDYRRNYVELSGAFIAPGAAAPDFDSISEIWFRSRNDYDAMLAARATPSIGSRIDRDEDNFLDRSKTRFFMVEELGAAIDLSPPRHPK